MYTFNTRLTTSVSHPLPVSTHTCASYDSLGFEEEVVECVQVDVEGNGASGTEAGPLPERRRVIVTITSVTFFVTVTLFQCPC